jgi:integrase
LFSRVPSRPVGRVSASERTKTTPESPYERIAFDLRQQILTGQLTDGDTIPAEKKLQADYDVSAGTAHRATELLKTWGLVETSRGRPTTIAAGAAAQAAAEHDTAEPVPCAEPPTQPHDGPELLQFQVRRLGELVRTFTAEADPSEASQLRTLLAASVRRDGHDVSEILDYELDVRRFDGELLTTFVTMSA